ncbi:MAG: peptidoglycan DD-metalloendopeptidase family protein [Aggregatilineales bacterium]
MAHKTNLRVGDRQVRIRSIPALRGEFIRWMDPGEQIDADSRTEADGYVWWQHAEGWSAEKSIDGAEMYLFPVAVTPSESSTTSAPEPSATVKFSVQIQVRVRSAPALSGEHIRWIDPGSQVVVAADSRIEADGYVWWRHEAGWSAEKSTNGNLTFMTKIVAPVVTPTKPASTTVNQTIKDAAQENAVDSTTTSTPQKPTTTTTPDKTAGMAEGLSKKAFTIINKVRVRSAATLSGEHVGWLDPGITLEVDTDSRIETDGYIWWRHSSGWSAERNLENTLTFLAEPGSGALIDVAVGSGALANINGPFPSYIDGVDINTFPKLNTLFARSPFDLNRVAFWQYYGNNRFSQKIWSQGKRWYQFSQSLHAGLDYGVGSNTGAVQVVAGVDGGSFVQHITNFYAPNGLFVKVGDYTIIYGHVDKPRHFNPGDPINADTVIGEITFGGWDSTNHLHLEVRYKNTYAVNPILLMSEEMRRSIMARWKPYEQYFYSDNTWSKWLTPLDQPLIRLSGSVIGPNAR